MINAIDSVSLSKGRQFQQGIFKDIQRQQEIKATQQKHTDINKKALRSLGHHIHLTADRLYFCSGIPGKTKSKNKN